MYKLFKVCNSILYFILKYITKCNDVFKHRHLLFFQMFLLQGGYYSDSSGSLNGRMFCHITCRNVDSMQCDL